ncbi:MAG: hypothetical protein K1000chlam2_01058 [Chlamydiae bacterium]|nr:hypothetical protein [Chlamydiota bacterium]
MFSPVSPTFSLQLLNNPPGLKTFMSGQKPISEIEKLSKNPKFAQIPNDNAPYFGRWQVVWILVKFPFEANFFVFLSAISYLLNALNCCKSARIVSVLSRQMIRDFDQLTTQWNRRKPMLAPSINSHQTRSWDVYQYKSFPIKNVKNDLIYSLTAQGGIFQGEMKLVHVFLYPFLKSPSRWQGWVKWIPLLSSISELLCNLNHIKFMQEVNKDLFAPLEFLDREQKKTMQEFSGLYKKNPSAAFEFLKKKGPSDRFDIFLNQLDPHLKNIRANLDKLDNPKDLNLFFPGGVCRGSSTWFVYLYLKTQPLFKIPGQHARAVATQFKSGAPSQAALSQALYRPEVLLDIKNIEQKDHKISCHELDCNKESAREKIRTLSEGIYRVGVHKHSIVYIKISDTKGYVWDPNDGLFPMTGEEMFQMVRKDYHKSGDPDSKIKFEKFENLQPQSE